MIIQLPFIVTRLAPALFLYALPSLCLSSGWHGVLLEGDASKFTDLQQRYDKNKQVTCINQPVAFEGDKCLDSLLKATTVAAVPIDLDLLSIGIDGNDYHVWDGLSAFSPKLVVIEFNPTIGNNVIYIQVL